jgi:DNA-binding transcriptional regulator GbsR (MarR family)
MTTTTQRLAYAEKVADVWASRYRVPPIAGRIAGYLYVCDPAAQSIDELATVLRASRSAVVGSVKILELHGLVRRTRTLGERVDRVRLVFDESRGFDSTRYLEAAEIAAEGVALADDAEQRRVLAETASLNAFLAARMPQLLDEWRSTR